MKKLRLGLRIKLRDKVKKKVGDYMPHPLWCGDKYSECSMPCVTDTSMPCSPDCENIDSKTGEPLIDKCGSCDAIT